MIVGTHPLPEFVINRAANLWRVERIGTQEIARKLQDEFALPVYEHQVYNALAARWDHHRRARLLQGDFRPLRRRHVA